MALTKVERLEKYPSIQFECAWCKIEVITDSTDKVDKRTRFCCAKCERQWWRRETRHPLKLTVLYKNQAFRDVNKFDR